MTAPLSLDHIRSLHAGIEGEHWRDVPAMTDDTIIMHRVYDDEGHCIAECSSPSLAAFIAAAPSMVAHLLGIVERVEALMADPEHYESQGPHDGYVSVENLRAALTGEGGA